MSDQDEVSFDKIISAVQRKNFTGLSEREFTVLGEFRQRAENQGKDLIIILRDARIERNVTAALP